MDAVVQLMLKSRGIEGAAADVEGLEGKLQKYGPILVWNTLKERVSISDIESLLSKLEETGAAQGIIIVKSSPSPNLMKRIRKESAKLQLFHEDQLRFDIMQHRKVPPHRILPAEEREAFLKKYAIERPETQMPLLDSQDPVGKWIGAKPGDIVEIMRRSDSAGSTPYYRCCVTDVSL